jgi:quercetin dioxygenase-like cupin family protein
MPNIVNADQYENLDWQVEVLDGDDKVENWNFSTDADGVRSMVIRIPKGYEYRAHKHLDWTQVIIVRGKIRIETKDKKVSIVESGGAYFVPPGEIHSETMMENSTVIVLTGLKELTTRKLLKTNIQLD